MIDHGPTVLKHAGDLLVGNTGIFPFDVFATATGGHLIEDNRDGNPRAGDNRLTIANTRIDLDSRIHRS